MAMENYHGLATGIASGTALIGGSGNLVTISGAIITVKDAGTANISSIFSDEGVTALANPFTADSSGRYNFYAADGDYDITVSKTGFTSYTLLDVSSNSNNFDPTTTRGDVIIRNATNIIARLAIGTDKQVLQSDGTDIAWKNNIASNITNVPAGNIVATDVQAAINELDSKAYILIQDQKAQNTDGGTVTNGAWRTRDLNTEVVDTGNNATLATNQITLGAGTYRFKAFSPAYLVAKNQAKLVQDVGGTPIDHFGTSQWSTNGAGGDTVVSVITGRFTIASNTVFEVQHRVQASRASDGFGVSGNYGTEVYTSIEFWKE